MVFCGESDGLGSAAGPPSGEVRPGQGGPVVGGGAVVGVVGVQPLVGSLLVALEVTSPAAVAVRTAWKKGP